MISVEKYIINKDFMYMVGQHDRNGKLCTIVTEINRVIIVDRSPLEILDDSIRCIGFNLSGAMETSKMLLCDKHMCPVMVNPIHMICVFPNKSAKRPDAIWFNPDLILRTSILNRKARIEFKNGLIIIVPSNLYSFNHKLQTAEQFKKIMTDEEKKPLTFTKSPKKGHRKGPKKRA
ncbi:competence protein ComK [Neobacillus sp. 19]